MIRLLLYLLSVLFFDVAAQNDSLAMPATTMSATTQTDTTRIPYTILSGSVSGLLGIDKSPYLAETDIFIPPGSSVSIEGGVVILFKNFTGLQVQGSLFAKGTPEHPVVFTSVNDHEYNQDATVNAAPYDWNGIDVFETAFGTSFDTCIIQYSVYGIRSQMKGLRIFHSYFIQNGKSDLSVNDSLFSIDTAAFSLVSLLPEPEVLQMSAHQQLSLPVVPPDEAGRAKTNEWLRALLRYSGLILASGGIAFVVQEYDDFTRARNEFNVINKKTEENMQIYTSSDWDRALRNLRKETIITGAFGGAGMIGLVLFGFSFTF